MNELNMNTEAEVDNIEDFNVDEVEMEAPDDMMEYTDAHKPYTTRLLLEDEEVTSVVESMEELGFELNVDPRVEDIPEHHAVMIITQVSDVENGASKVTMINKNATIAVVPRAEAVSEELTAVVLNAIIFKQASNGYRKLIQNQDSTILTMVEQLLPGIKSPEALTMEVLFTVLKSLTAKVKVNIPKSTLLNAIKSKSYAEAALSQQQLVVVEQLVAVIGPKFPAIVDTFNTARVKDGKAVVNVTDEWLLETLANRDNVDIEFDMGEIELDFGNILDM